MLPQWGGEGMLKKLIRWIWIILTLAGAVFMLLRGQYHDVAASLARTQVMNVTSDLINDAIDRQIEEGAIAYDRMVYFEKDLDGRITALKTNMGLVNRLKTDTLNRINDEIMALDSDHIGIPLGSLFLPELLAGKGPRINVRVLSIRNSEADFLSRFSEAGINQTLHQLTLVVSVDVAVLVLGKTEHFTVGSEVVVAETVIVGIVPETYLQTGGNNGS